MLSSVLTKEHQCVTWTEVIHAEQDETVIDISPIEIPSDKVCIISFNVFIPPTINWSLLVVFLCPRELQKLLLNNLFGNKIHQIKIIPVCDCSDSLDHDVPYLKSEPCLTSTSAFSLPFQRVSENWKIFHIFIFMIYEYI